MRKIFLALALTFLTTTVAAAVDENIGGVILHESKRELNAISDIYTFSVTNKRSRIVCVFITVRPGGWGYTMGLSNAVVYPGERSNLGWVKGDKRNTGSGYEFGIDWNWAEKGHIDCP